MAIKRTVSCDIKNCDSTATEPEFGRGFNGWMQIVGVELNGSKHPYICPRCMFHVMEIVDGLDANDYPPVDFSGDDG